MLGRLGLSLKIQLDWLQNVGSRLSPDQASQACYAARQLRERDQVFTTVFTTVFGNPERKQRSHPAQVSYSHRNTRKRNKQTLPSVYNFTHNLVGARAS